jgi:hypothetical protein
MHRTVMLSSRPEHELRSPEPHLNRADDVFGMHSHGILVDSTSFHMARSEMDSDWRDANIIPRYNSAGVRRFAFHMPPGMPAIGAEPAPEGPADFPTGYFGSRDAARAWLKS